MDFEFTLKFKGHSQKRTHTGVVVHMDSNRIHHHLFTFKRGIRTWGEKKVNDGMVSAQFAALFMTGDPAPLADELTEDVPPPHLRRSVENFGHSCSWDISDIKWF